MQTHEVISLLEKVVTIEYLEEGKRKKRKFVLREMTAQDLMETYIEFQQHPYRTIEDLVHKPEADLLDATRKLYDNAHELFVWLLREPGDGEDPPDQDWVKTHIGFRQRQRIVAIQDELNSMAEMVGNVNEVLMRAKNKAGAQKILKMSGKNLESNPGVQAG